MNRSISSLLIFLSISINCFSGGNEVLVQIKKLETDLVQNDYAYSSAKNKHSEALIALAKVNKESKDEYNPAAEKWNTECSATPNEGDCPARMKQIQDWEIRLTKAYEKDTLQVIYWKNRSDSLLNASYTIKNKIFTLKEQNKYDLLYDLWVKDERACIDKAVTADSLWTKNVLRSLRTDDLLDIDSRPRKVEDLIPGDILLVAPSQFAITSKDAWIEQGIFLANKVYKGELTSDDKASHSITFIKRDEAGHAIFLDNTSSIGAHFITENEFLQHYGKRDMSVARIRKPVDGEILMKAAADAVEASKKSVSDYKIWGHTLFTTSNYGVGQGDMVCSMTAGFMIELATGVQLLEKDKNKQRYIDITPLDFFDKKKQGYYFIVSPLEK